MMGTKVSRYHGSSTAGLLNTLGVLVLVAGRAGAQITPSAPALLNTNGTGDLGYDYSPEVTTDGAGTWVAVWDSNENLACGTDFP